MASCNDLPLFALDQQVAEQETMASRFIHTNSAAGGTGQASSGVYSSTGAVEDKAFSESFARESSPAAAGSGMKSTSWIANAQPQPVPQQSQSQQQPPQKFTTERRASTPRSTSSGVSSPRSSTATSNTSNLSQSSFGFGGSASEMVSAGGGGRSGSITSLQQQPQHAHGFVTGGAGVASQPSFSLDSLDGNITSLLRMYDEYNALMNAYNRGEQVLSVNCENGRVKLANNSEEIMKIMHNYVNMRRVELDTWHAQHIKELHNLAKDANTQRERIKGMVEQLQHAKRFYEKQPPEQPHQLDNNTKQCIRAAEELKVTEQPLLAQQQAQVKMLALRCNLSFVADIEAFRSNIHKFGGYFMDQLSAQQQQLSSDGANSNKNSNVSASSSGLASHVGSSSSSGCNSNSSDGNSGHTSPTAMAAQPNGVTAANGQQRPDEVDAGGNKRPFPAAPGLSDVKFGCAPSLQFESHHHVQSDEMSQLLPFRSFVPDSTSSLASGASSTQTLNHNNNGSSNWAEAANENAERMALGSRKYVASSTSASQQLQRSTSVQQSPPHSHVGSTSRLLDGSVSLQQTGREDLHGIGRSGSCSGFSGATPVVVNGQHATSTAGFGGGDGWLQASSGFDGSNGSGSLIDSTAFGSTSTLSHNTNSALCDSRLDSRMTGTIPLTPASSSSVQHRGGSVRRHKIRFSFKIGSDKPSVDNGKFSEPSGVVSTPLGELIVADTNNHRIQVFNSDGTFKLCFGEAGRRNGQLLYPNRVAYCVMTKRIIITERAPTHQVQAFTENGCFDAKFGADILEHPRGVTVDHLGQIIIVECRIMRVVIFNRHGEELTHFKCANLEFPNGVAVDKQERIFISDNRAHCVRVFNYAGNYLLDIGGDNLTNYPIGVCVTPNGNVLVADNHNNFNITLFTPEGKLLEFYESSVKHAQCLDIALIDEGVVALASKDFKVYVYPFGNGAIQMPPLPPPSNGVGGCDYVDHDVDLSMSFRASNHHQQQNHQLQLTSSGGGIERSPGSMRHHLHQRITGAAGGSSTPSNVRRDQYYDTFSQQRSQQMGLPTDDSNAAKYSQHAYHRHHAATPTSENMHSAFDFPLVASPDHTQLPNGYGTNDSTFTYGGRMHQQHQPQQQHTHDNAGNSFDLMHYSNNNVTKMTGNNYSYGSSEYNMVNNTADDVFSASTTLQPSHHQQHVMPQQLYNNGYDSTAVHYNNQSSTAGTHMGGAGDAGGGHLYGSKMPQNSMYAEQQYMNSASPFGSSNVAGGSHAFKQAMQYVANNNVATQHMRGTALSAAGMPQQSVNLYGNAFATHHGGMLNNGLPRASISGVSSMNAAQQLQNSAWGTAAMIDDGGDLDVTNLTNNFQRNMMLANDDAVAGSGGLYGGGNASSEKKNFLDE